MPGMLLNLYYAISEANRGPKKTDLEPGYVKHFQSWPRSCGFFGKEVVVNLALNPKHEI